ncbi:MAG: hypothetical protein Q4C49_10735 [Bacillota bacterium]|nr:hypothetical protein [Bacillota bacterium]
MKDIEYIADDRWDPFEVIRKSRFMTQDEIEKEIDRCEKQAAEQRNKANSQDN